MFFLKPLDSDSDTKMLNRAKLKGKQRRVDSRPEEKGSLMIYHDFYLVSLNYSFLFVKTSLIMVIRNKSSENSRHGNGTIRESVASSS